MIILRRSAACAALFIALTRAALSQNTQPPLPDVNVTAPANTESFITRGFTTPYAGHIRVEEDKWPVVPCATARISTASGGGTCQNGAPTETSMSLAGRQEPNCTIYHQLVTFQTGALAVEADSLIFDPFKIVSGSPTGHQDKNCLVWSGYLRLPDDFHDMNQVARRGTNWQNFVKGNPLSTMQFADGNRACLAVEKLGPPWRGGYIWVVHASICQPDARPVQPSDIAAVLGGLRLDRYDPLGNLQAPSGDTIYSAGQ